MFLSAKAIETHIFHSCSELTLHKLANDRRTEETEDSIFPASSCSKPLDRSADDPTVLLSSIFCKKGKPLFETRFGPFDQILLDLAIVDFQRTKDPEILLGPF